MKKSTKNLIKKLLDKEIGSLNSSIRSCELGNRLDVMTAHIDKLKEKIVKLNEAIEELESA